MFGFFKKKATSNDPGDAAARGDYETALKLYRKKLQEEPGREAILQKKIAETLVQAGRKEEAIGAYLTSAAAFEREDRMLQAIALYKAVLRLEPKNAQVLAKLSEFASEERPSGPEAERELTLRTRLNRHVPLFSEFDRDELTEIVQCMLLHALPAGQVIFQQGEMGESLYIIVTGEVALVVAGKEEGESVEVCRLTDGTLFGEVSALDRTPRNVTAMTTRPTEFLELTRDYLEALAVANPRIWQVLERFQQERQLPAGV